jgi:hypothetical protein
MSFQTMSAAKGGSLGWAWKLIDRHRRREHVDGNQIEIALAAIANVTGRGPISGSLTYEFPDEDILRRRATPR